MKLLKKCYYLILFAAVGIVYLSVVDQWQVYAGALEQVKEFCMGGSSRENPGKSEGQGEAGGQNGQENQGEENSLKEQEDPNGAGGQDGPGGQHSAGGQGAGTGEEGPGGSRDGQAPEANDPAGADAGQEPAEGGEGTGGPAVPPEQAEAAPVFGTVEDDYFSDAVFIGDSRTVGMYEYGGLEDIAAFYASTGLTVYKIFDSPIVEVPGQKKKITVEEALQANSFGKIYLMIGINEMGRGTVETFTEKYREVVAHLQELQPEAVIYIQGIIKVTTERSGQGDYINNEGIEARNAELAKLADNKSIFYLDVNPLICDETGGMVDTYTFDGVHLKAKYIQIWKDYLKENAVLTTPPPQEQVSG